MEKGYWKDQIAEFHRLLPKGNIIEIGAGGGRDARELVELGYNYVGTDISKELLKEARKNVPGQKFIRQSLYDLSFDEKFDGFWACAVLLHVPKKRISEALKSIKSVLKKGAVGFISVKKGSGEKVIENDQRFFSFWGKSEFSKVLQDNGFKIVGYVYDPRTPDDKWHCYFVRAL